MGQDADGRACPADIAGALADVARWLDTAKGDQGWLSSLRFGVAGALAQTPETDLAEAGFRKILSDHPGHLWAWIGRIDLALARGDAPAAVAIGQDGLTHLPQDRLLRRKTAEALEQAEGPVAALALLQGGGNPEIGVDDLRYAISLHRAAQTVGLALPLCIQLLHQSPDDALALLARIEAHLTRGETADAVAAAQAALARHPKGPEMRLRAAQAHLMAGDRARAADLAKDMAQGTAFAAAFRTVLAQSAGSDAGAGSAPPPAKPATPDLSALMAALEAMAQPGGPPGADAHAKLLDLIRASGDLPWYGAIALVQRACSLGAFSLAQQIAAACADAPWPPADRQAFAIEDALLRKGPRAAMDWIAAHPTPRRDAEAAARIGRVLVAAGTGPLAARYLGRACRRWPAEAALQDLSAEALIACGAADTGPQPPENAASGPFPATVGNGAQDPSPALRIAAIERHLLTGDLVAAEACLAALSPHDGPMAEALICRPRSTQLGTLLNEARVLAAMGIDWSGADRAALAPLAADFFLPARRVVDLWLEAQGMALLPAVGTRPDRLHLIWPTPLADRAEERRIIAAWAASGFPDPQTHTPAERPGWLRRHHGIKAARAYARADDAAQKADLFMLALLLDQGGIAVLGPQWPNRALARWCHGLADSVMFRDGAGALVSDVIMGPKGHPVIAAAWEMALDACLQGEREHRWFKTGPGLLTRAMARVILAEGLAPEALGLVPLRALRQRLHPYRPAAIW